MPPRHHGSVLVDTNVVIEAHRTRTWNALTGGYCMETVEDCVIETQTGFQRHDSKQSIDAAELRASLAAIHHVSSQERKALKFRVPGAYLDRGEEALWAHTLQRTDTWILCGPDKASLQFGSRLGFRERLISMEKLLEDVGYRRPKIALREPYTKRWHKRTMSTLKLAER